MRRGAFVPVAGFLAVLLLSAAQGAPDADEASLRHGGGWTGTGRIDGACDAIGIAHGATGSTHQLWSSPSNLVWTQVWTNYTRLVPSTGAPIQRDVSHHESTTSVALDVGWIAFAEGREAQFVPWGPGSEGSPSIHLQFSARQATAGWMRASGFQADPPPAWQEWAAAASPPASAWMPVRLADARWTVDGPLQVFMRDVRIEGGGQTIVIPADTREEETLAPGVILVHEQRHVARWESRAAHWTESRPELVAYCERLEARVEGSYAVYDASGRLAWRGVETRLEHRALVIEGVLRVRETPGGSLHGDARGFATADVGGQFGAVTIDGVWMATPAEPGLRLPANAWWIGAALLSAALLAGFLYTRLQNRDIFRRGERRLLWEAIKNAPTITFTELQQHVGTSSTNLRYHLRVLEREGYTKGVRVHGRYHYVPADRDPEDVRRRLLAERDPAVRTLLDELTQGEARAAELVNRLQQRCGISRSAGWKVVERAWRARLVEKRHRERRMILRASS